MYNKEWFESRGKNYYKYQEDAVNDVQQSMEVREKTVLAACPSAGKTLMSIFIIEEYLKNNPTHKVLVLAHGTTVLRTQFHDVLEENKLDFTYTLVETCDDYNNANTQVIVCLPQTLHRCKIKSAQLLIVDEAHEFYFAKRKDEKKTMVQRIIDDAGIEKQLLLTGTPSKFILHKYYIVAVSLNTVYEAGNISETYVELASSSYNFNLNDFNEQGELKQKVTFSRDATNNTLDELIKKIHEHLKKIRGNDYINLVPEWLPTLKKLKKTMLVCTRQSMAKQIYKYFQELGINCVLSISDSDDDSEEIKRFKKDEDVILLIVVKRGILGFNYPELVNVVDMTMRYNIDIIFQLLCRVVRKSDTEKTKLFFKLAPSKLAGFYQHIMAGVIMMGNKNFYLKYNGKNLNDMEIPIKKPKKIKSIYSGGGTSNGKRSKTKKYEPIDFGEFNIFENEIFQEVLHQDDSILNMYAWTTIGKVRSQYTNFTRWTLEMCMEDALKHNTKSEWQNSGTSGYQIASRNGWLELCCKHMIEKKRPNGLMTLEYCIKESKKYNTPEELRKNDIGLSSKIISEKWQDECYDHMTRKTKINALTFEECLEDALKYRTPTEWKKYSSRIYYYVMHRKEWKEKCYAHMGTYSDRHTYWTIERLKADALKYKSRSEWQKNSPSAYQSALRRNLLDICCQHMSGIIEPKYKHSDEECLVDALKYPSKNLWKINSFNIYNSVRAFRKELFKKCTSHMKRGYHKKLRSDEKQS